MGAGEGRADKTKFIDPPKTQSALLMRSNRFDPAPLMGYKKEDASIRLIFILCSNSFLVMIGFVLTRAG